MVKELVKAVENENIVKFNNLAAQYISKKLAGNETIKKTYSEIERYNNIKSAYENISKGGE